MLIHSALFVLTPFHLYSITYDALICIGRPHLQAIVHRECTEIWLRRLRSFHIQTSEMTIDKYFLNFEERGSD